MMFTKAGSSRKSGRQQILHAAKLHDPKRLIPGEVRVSERQDLVTFAIVRECGIPLTALSGPPNLEARLPAESHHRKFLRQQNLQRDDVINSKVSIFCCADVGLPGLADTGSEHAIGDAERTVEFSND